MIEENLLFEYSSPESITIITTYKCTAACQDCCFESNPTIKGKLDEGKIKDFILESYNSFNDLKVVVFTGGEPLLLGRSLFNCIEYASSFGLATRIVTNGYWGKTPILAKKITRHLKDANLSEINISTGIDHAKFVPVEHVINAIQALSEENIPNRVTVESDFEDGSFYKNIIENYAIKEILSTKPEFLSFQINTWMPFHTDSKTRKPPAINVVDIPCTQLFNNFVLTPHGRVSSCCGLTFEHIDQLKVGEYQNGNLKDLYKSQFEDFLKIWINIEGPLAIIRKAMGDEFIANLGDIHHLCQACALLHKDERVLNKLKDVYPLYIEEILSKYSKNIFLKKIKDELRVIKDEA